MQVNVINPCCYARPSQHFGASSCCMYGAACFCDNPKNVHVILNLMMRLCASKSTYFRGFGVGLLDFELLDFGLFGLGKCLRPTGEGARVYLDGRRRLAPQLLTRHTYTHRGTWARVTIGQYRRRITWHSKHVRDKGHLLIFTTQAVLHHPGCEVV
jgi:hypothetical protein